MIPRQEAPHLGQALDHPRRRPFDRDQAIELGASGAAGLALVWVPFHLAGWNAPFGFVVCWFLVSISAYGAVIRQRHGVLEMKDRLATLLVTAGTGVAVLPLGLLVWFTFTRGASVLFNHFPSFPFLRQDMHRFGVTDPLSRAGMKHAIIGTLEQVGTATLLSVPIGVLAATYLNEVGGRYAAIVRTVADAMTGLPTIIAGLFLYAFWVEPKGGLGFGFSGLAAALALTVVMLPTVVRTAEEVLRIVASGLREAALALGAPQWRTVLQVVIPTARTGLVTASLLGIARAVGETAPVTLTAFGAQRTNVNLLHLPQADLPLQVYLLVRSASNKNVEVAWGGALLLIMMVLTLFVLARILGTGTSRRRPGPIRTAGRLLRGD